MSTDVSIFKIDGSGYDLESQEDINADPTVDTISLQWDYTCM